ncbi:MAG: RsiV family protein [Fibromonadaceae bacterium]|jgi:hypothetical protein|nr:RsiV family protein [Fibromonadaceae bacterium]
MKKIPLLLLALACLASAQGIISFNTVYLDTAGKFFFTYPVALPNPVALKELQKNFIKQKFGEKFLEQESAPVPAPAPVPSRPEPPAKASNHKEPAKTARKEPVVVVPSCPELVPCYQEPATILSNYKNQFKEVETLSDVVSFPLPGIVQYTTAAYIYYVDAAHGQNKFSMGVYSLVNGKEIELATLFIKGWEKNVVKLIIREFLLAMNLQSLADYNYTKKEEDFVPEHMRISSSGMEFVYPAYKIAPHSAGEQSVFLSWNALKPYLNKKSIIYPKLQF